MIKFSDEKMGEIYECSIKKIGIKLKKYIHKLKYCEYSVTILLNVFQKIPYIN
ncbi:hypothetical protein [Clostridium ganghwense]|uniref:hypothetical protein n=1 Tax=Clostridium ganghwense TaxID=312089 RepID=UPI00227C0B44|nr:hypothetical protein [Clostridium ganghwense]